MDCGRWIEIKLIYFGRKKYAAAILSSNLYNVLRRVKNTRAQVTVDAFHNNIFTIETRISSKSPRNNIDINPYEKSYANEIFENHTNAIVSKIFVEGNCRILKIVKSYSLEEVFFLLFLSEKVRIIYPWFENVKTQYQLNLLTLPIVLSLF